MATGEGQASDPLLMPVQTEVARSSLNSVFRVEINLYHLLPGGVDQAQGRRDYYLRTHKVDPLLPETPEEEEEEKMSEVSEDEEDEEDEEEDWPRKRPRGKGRGQGQGRGRGRVGGWGRGRGSSAAPSATGIQLRQRRQLQPSGPGSLTAKQRRQLQASGSGSYAQEQTTLAPAEESEEHVETRGLKNFKRNDGTRECTGFAIAENGTSLRILTCAHVIDEIYAPGLHDITVGEVNNYYSIDVYCSHQEKRVLRELNGKPIEEQVRFTTQAAVVAIDTSKDLMVLEIDTDHIRYKSGSDKCSELHPPIDMVRSDPTELQTCILHGWAPQRMSSLSVGQLSFDGRLYDSISAYNVKGYDMKPMEFTRMEGVSGTSGAPVLNGLGQSSGVFHGLIGDMAYVVSAKDVIHFFNKFNVLTEWSAMDDQE